MDKLEQLVKSGQLKGYTKESNIEDDEIYSVLLTFPNNQTLLIEIHKDYYWNNADAQLGVE